jgi:hypothetical protein
VLAVKYFTGLMRDPESVELGGVLGDVTRLNADSAAALQSFGETLQQQLAALARLQPTDATRARRRRWPRRIGVRHERPEDRARLR